MYILLLTDLLQSCTWVAKWGEVTYTESRQRRQVVCDGFPASSLRRCPGVCSSRRPSWFYIRK